MSTLNRRRFSVTNTPGASGDFTVGPAVAPSLGLDATHDGLSMDVTIDEGSSWEIRRACTYTHSGTTLSRGTLEDSSTGSAISFTSAAVVRVVATAVRMAAGQLVDVPFAAAVRFDGQRQMAQTTVTGAIAFTVNTSNAIDGAVTQVDLIANGTNAPTFSSDFREWGGSMGYDNRSGYRNCLTMFRRASVYWYSWAQAIGATAEPTPATAVTMSGPSSGVVSVASSNFTIGANGSITGTVTVTPSDSSGGGTFTPTTVNISAGSPTATFTYTPGSTGAKTISVTNNGGLSNPSNITYTSNAAATVPDAPTIGAATAGDTTASVTFTAPGSDGGSTITGYTATSSPGGLTGTGASSPITVTGLTNGTAYTFAVTATNAVGTGSASAASNSVTPAGAGVVTRLVSPSNVTETGDGTAGWNYSNTNSNLFTVGTGQLDKSLASGVDGSFEFTISATLGSSRQHIAAIDSVGANAQTVFQCDYGIWVQETGAIAHARNGTYTTLSGVTATGGEKIRLARVGTTAVMSMSST